MARRRHDAGITTGVPAAPTGRFGEIELKIAGRVGQSPYSCIGPFGKAVTFGRKDCGMSKAAIAWSEMSLNLPENSDSTQQQEILDRKSTRLNSSHLGISYAVFCLK